VFSDGLSEGRTRDINEGFPFDSDPYTEHYDYLSDSDLEDGSSCSEEEEEESPEGDLNSPRRPEDVPDSGMSKIIVSGSQLSPPLPVETSAANGSDRSTPLIVGRFQI